ncbi:MAG: hypothetical protein Q9194_006447 [Teloschistes cf. exilis]
METKETSTEGERVTVCWMVTGSGVGGVCTKDVKTMDTEGIAVVKRDGWEVDGKLETVVDDNNANTRDNTATHTRLTAGASILTRAQGLSEGIRNREIAGEDDQKAKKEPEMGAPG